MVRDHRSFLRGEVSFYLGGISAIVETVVWSTMPIANLKRGLMDGSARIDGRFSEDRWTMVRTIVRFCEVKCPSI